MTTASLFSYNRFDDEYLCEDPYSYEYECPSYLTKRDIEVEKISDEVADLESTLSIAHLLGLSQQEISDKKKRLDDLVSKYQVSSISKLHTLVYPLYKAHVSTKVVSSQSVVSEEDQYVSSEEEIDMLRDFNTYTDLIIELAQDKVFGVRYLGTVFEFPTWPEALAFSSGRNLPEPILITSCKLLGGVKKRPGKRKRTRPRKRNGTIPLIQSKQLGQVNRFVPYDKPVTTTLRFNAVLQTDGSGTLSARLSLRNPLRAFNGSSEYVNAQDYAALYDQYKVKRLSFQFEPSTTGPLRGGIVVAFDYDSPDTSTPNYANIVNYGGYRIFNAGLQFEIASHIPDITSGFNVSTDPPSALIVHRGGWIDAATPAASGNMFLGGVNLGNSVTLGSFVATLLVAWRFRR